MNPQAPPLRSWFQTAGVGVLLFGLLLLAYWPALRGGFIWDDDVYVTHNPLLTAADGWQRIWFSAHRQSQFFPLVYTTFRLEHALWGLNPLGYHLVNLLLHAANAFLVWMVLRKLAVLGAWIAAALFAFHPVQVESVAWITELKNTQSTLFYLLAVLTWLRFLGARRAAWGCYALTLSLYLLALLSKTTACTLPAVLLLVAWLRGERLGWRRALQIMPLLVMGIAAGAVSIWWESHLGNYQEDVGQSLTLVQRTLIASRALWFYAAKLAWPLNLTFSYPHWLVNVNRLLDYVPLVGCLAVAWAFWHWRERAGRQALGAVVFFVAVLSPLLGFIPLYTFRYSFVADHYQYLACVGLLALAAAGLSQMPRILPVVMLTALGVLTWQQAHIYRDQTSLWLDTLAKNPASWMAHNNLGMILKDQGQFGPASQQYQEAIRLYPGHAQAHYNFGVVLFKQGQTGQAMAQFREAIRLDPSDSRAYYNFAIALDATGQPDEAIKHYEQAIRLNPDYAEARINLGISFSRQGRVDDAMTQFQEAVRLAPSNAEAHNNLGAVLRAKGRLREAIEQFSKAIRCNPGHALARANLGAAFLAEGRFDDAIPQLEEAVRLDPGDTEARRNLNRALEMNNTASPH